VYCNTSFLIGVCRNLHHIHVHCTCVHSNVLLEVTVWGWCTCKQGSTCHNVTTLHKVRYASIKTMRICGNHFHYSAALALQPQLQKTQTQLKKIHKRSCTVFRKLMCVGTQCSSEELSHLILWRSLLICGVSCTANAIQKMFPKDGIIS